ncbi:WG repeat-containing protein [Sphingomonas sp.]|uniref:WG repeat-containing protein n=1 Tax=Sphingomonas sp. TaxID=28214 RepID=UPI003B3B7CE3
MLAILLLTVLAASSAPAPRPDGDALLYPLGCSYSGPIELTPVDHCASHGSGLPHLAPQVVADLAYDHGLASIAIAGKGWFYRRRDGRMVQMVTFDNGPDPFSEGLARAIVKGRLAFVDRRLRLRFVTRYTAAEPFRHGRAIVCTGCVETPVDDGEHSYMSGGRWGVIDRRGREIIPPTQPYSHFAATAERLGLR